MMEEPVPADMDIVLAWEVFRDSEEGMLFDVTCLERLDLVTGLETEGPCDTLQIDAFKLPLGSVVLVCIPK